MGLLDRLRSAVAATRPVAPRGDHGEAFHRELVRAYGWTQFYSGPLSTAQDNLTGETWEVRQAYRRMLKEPAVSTPLRALTMAVASLDPQVIPEDKADPRQKAAAAYVDWAVGRSRGGWPRLLMNLLLPGQIDGFGVCEKVMGAVPADHPRYPGHVTLLAAKSKDTEHLRFRLDEYKAVTGVVAVGPAGQGGRVFDPADFLVFTHLSIFESPFGLSALRPANRAANLIAAAVKLRSILLENFSGPFLTGRYPAGDTATRDQMAAVLRDARAQGWITYPDGAEVEVLNLATSAPDQFQQTIEDLRKELFLCVRGAYLQALESSSPQGSGETHRSQTELFEWYLATAVCSVLDDQLVPDLVGPNFGAAGGRPKVTLGGIDPAAQMRQLELIEKAQQMGYPVSGQQVGELSGAEPARDAGDVLRPATPAGDLPPPAGRPAPFAAAPTPEGGAGQPARLFRGLR
jgi:hypothetical protein